MEKVNFLNKDGEKLAARLDFPKNKTIAYALFAHCFTCSKDLSAVNTIAKNLNDHNIAVLRFDFTGLGSSEGEFSNTNFSSNISDLISACEFLSENYEPPSILIGHSLGGAAVLKAAAELEHIKAVVTIGAPSDVAHIKNLFKDSMDEIKKNQQATVSLAGREFTIKKQMIDDLSETNVTNSLKNLKKAVLIMHSPIDKTVSIDHAAKIFQSLKHPKSFISLDDADHLLMKKEDAKYAANLIGAWVVRYIENNSSEEKNYAPKGEVIVKSREGLKFTQDIYTDSHHIIADEPKSMQGNNLGLPPYELLMSALGSCTSMTMRMYADRKNINLSGSVVRLKHEKVEVDGEKVDKFTKKITLKGDFNIEEKNKLFEIADKCPINRTLKSQSLTETISE